MENVSLSPLYQLKKAVLWMQQHLFQMQLFVKNTKYMWYLNVRYIVLFSSDFNV